MEFDLPDELKISRQEYFEQYKQDVITVSETRYTDFSDSSVLTVLGEVQALFIEKLQKFQAEIIPFIQSDMLARIGFIRSSGTTSKVTLRVLLENKFDRNFTIQRGTKFSLALNRVAVFQTTADLVIPPNIDTSDPNNYQYCRIQAESLEIGEFNNQPAQQAALNEPIDGVNSVWTDEPSRDGTDIESPETFMNRVSLTIAKFLEQRVNLIIPSEFETAVKGILGNNSSVIAISDVSSDGSTVQLASMLIFALNADGSALTEAQITNLIADIGSRSPLVGGRLYFRSMVVISIDINISLKIDTSQDANTITNKINTAILQRFNIEKTALDGSLEFYELITLIKTNGAIEPIATWGEPGDALEARNLALPRLCPASNKTSPAKIRRVVFTIEPIGSQIIYNN